MIWFVIFCFLFYSLNITGFKIKNFVLAKSCLTDEPIDLVFWVPYAASVVTFIFAPSVGQWMLLGIFIFFHIACFFTTYKYWIWPSDEKTSSYHSHFSETHHIFKVKEKILTPDTFHIGIFTLLGVNLIAIIVYILI